MRMLDRLFSIGALGALSLAFIPVSMAQGLGFGMDFDGEGFVGANIDCTQWEEGSFQRNMCERIQERVQKHVEMQTALEDACGERADTDEYRECVRDYRDAQHEEKKAEMDAKRAEVEATCGEYDRGTAEHRDCVKETVGDDFGGGMGHMMGRRAHSFFAKATKDKGFGRGGPDDHRGRGFGMRISEETRAAIEACHEIDDREEKHDCIEEVRVQASANASANANQQ